MFAVNRRKAENIIERNLRMGTTDLSEADSKEILEAYGFVTPKGSIATTSEQAAGIAEQIGFPVVMKIWSPDLTHKSDLGGVVLGLENKREVMDAFDLMMYRIPKKAPKAKILGVLVQEMCRRGKEVVIGMNRDPHFGPLIMFGMGGTMVEVLKDVTFYLAPLTAEEAKQMLMNTKTYKVLKGFRGEEGVDIDAIAESLQRLSQLVTEFPQIQELDINPYIVSTAGTAPVAVDARMRVKKI
jgi:acetyltransferase